MSSGNTFFPNNDHDDDSENNLKKDEQTPTLVVEDFLDLNGDDYSAEQEAKQRKASDWFLLAARAYVHNQFDLAITYFDKVLELEPENDRAYANRADVYADKEEYGEALSDYMMAAHLGGDAAKALLAEFKADLQAKKLMDEQGRLLISTTTAKTPSSYLQKMDESELGDDMHIVDLQASADDFEDED